MAGEQQHVPRLHLDRESHEQQRVDTESCGENERNGRLMEDEGGLKGRSLQRELRSQGTSWFKGNKVGSILDNF